MQDKYVSLNPDIAQHSQSFSDRSINYSQRYQESFGGEEARGLGFVTGLTAATFVYARSQQAGFKFFPLQKGKIAHYTWILGAGFIAFHFGSAIGGGVSGDWSYQSYLLKNQGKILNGTANLGK